MPHFSHASDKRMCFVGYHVRKSIRCNVLGCLEKGMLPSPQLLLGAPSADTLERLLRRRSCSAPANCGNLNFQAPRFSHCFRQDHAALRCRHNIGREGETLGCRDRSGFLAPTNAQLICKRLGGNYEMSDSSDEMQQFYRSRPMPSSHSSIFANAMIVRA